MKSTLPTPPLKILLVDDHAVVRVGLRNLLQDEPDLHLVGEAVNCAHALKLASQTKPEVIVLDLRLPDGSGVDIIDPIKRLVPLVRVLVLTSFADDTLLLTALKAGADGYLLKDVAEADLVDAIREVARSGVVMPRTPVQKPSHSEELASDSAAGWAERLTGQERRVFELAGRGHSNREIAALTGLSEKTVRNYLGRVFEKLGLRRRAELVAIYVSSRPWRR